MKNYKKPLFIATALGALAFSTAYAGTLTVINNVPEQRIQLFIRGEGAGVYQTKVVEAGMQKDFIVNLEHVNGRNTFEVTASTGNGGHPDWKLMGGTCSNLVTDADHKLIIDAMLGKISCKNVTADNPSS